MSKELKRIPIDFNWPMKLIWKGYVNPYSPQKCTMCDETGSGPLYKALEDSWYGNGLSQCYKDNKDYVSIYNKNFGWHQDLSQDEVNHLCDEDRLREFCCEWKVPTTEEYEINESRRKALFEKNGKIDDYTPLAADKPISIRIKNPDGSNFYPSTDVINENANNLLIHDGINRFITVEFRAAKLGISRDKWYCKACDGDGSIWFSDEIKERYEKWYDEERYHPPNGDGYQLWETVSEGSPISPVFPNEKEMIHYLVSECGYEFEASRRFVMETQWCSSMMIKMENGQKNVKKGINTLC